ncbi:uncharacterized protein TNCV_4017621 [Trichonephila clavipes]|nr:uncharacterized protein TNCV_4017621 [Trichonephila clavipes]
MLELSAADSSQPGRPDHHGHFNPCDFWLWGYLKDVVFIAPISHLAELKSRIVQHILNVIPDTLRPIVEHTVSRFKLVTDNGGQ